MNTAKMIPKPTEESGARPPGNQAASGYRTRDVGVTFETAQGELEVLRSISFEAAAGEIIGTVGKSGTGKTTLLRVLGGLLPPTRGSVELDGKVIDGPPGTAITVFQDYANALLPWRTVSRNVALGLEKGFTKEERKARVDEALRLVGLSGRERDYPWRLSGGMQQRVQIARALAMRPKVLLMDEPFGALDAITKASLQDELLLVHSRTGATILFITHDLDEAIYLSDRVFVLAGFPGELTLQASTNLPRPRHQVTTRERPDYIALRHQLAEALQVGGADNAATTEGTPT